MSVDEPMYLAFRTGLSLPELARQLGAAGTSPRCTPAPGSTSPARNCRTRWSGGWPEGQDGRVPEGDTVVNTARALQEALAERTLTGSDFRVPALATTDLTGWTVRESASRGKHLLLRLARGDRRFTLHSHLRMDGAWRTYRRGARWTGGPAHLIRVALHTAETTAVGYHLHELALVPTDREDTLVGHLGPDLLGPDWDATEAVRRLAARPDLAIAEALLDSGTWPASATCTSAKSCTCAASPPGGRCPQWTICPPWWTWRTGCCRPTWAGGRRVRPAPSTKDRPRTCTGAGTNRAAAAAPRSVRPNRASGSPTGARPANPGRASTPD